MSTLKVYNTIYNNIQRCSDLILKYFYFVKERLSLVSINYHILFSLLQSIELLLKKEQPDSKQLELVLLDAIYESFRHVCSNSNETSKWHHQYVDSDEKLNNLIKIQQSALMSTLNLKSIIKFEKFHIRMKNIASFFF